MKTTIKEEASKTPDPERALRNLERLIDISPSFIELPAEEIGFIAVLFSISQFLADYCTTYPDLLYQELKNISRPISKDEVLSLGGSGTKTEVMKFLRDLRKRFYLRLTLRYIAGLTDIEGSMNELTLLAEAIIQIALEQSIHLMREKYGDIEDSKISIIALGKLGASELNYSSDIDIISVYRSDDSYTSGILLPSGVRVNRIHCHEYFCRLTETMASLLSRMTEDGIAYRVDLRLRPNGQKGDISLPIESYLSYYESWGKTWERMVMIRARPVAGDTSLGKAFIEALEPFVWKRSIDYTDIEEIRNLKRKIDSIAEINDIKRGYGGIREIEFFVQTFQLLHGGERKILRKPRLSEALTNLVKEDLIPPRDGETLLNTYLFLRRLEHLLQMRDDLQTHSLPSQIEDLDILSRKMGYQDHRTFLSTLRVERLKVRDMYNSILGDEETPGEDVWIFDEDITDSALRDYLIFRGFSDPEKAMRNIRWLLEYISFKKTKKERLLLRKVIPFFINRISKCINRDRALTTMTSLTEKIGDHESYLDLLSARKDTVEAIANAFCYSSYLTSLILSLENLEGLFEYPDIRLDYRALRIRLRDLLDMSHDPLNALRENKATEELKIGLLFTSRLIGIQELSKTLTVLADTILRALLDHLRPKDFAVIGLGRLGSKGLNFGSDLDLIFVSPDERAFKNAEEVIRFLSLQVEKGIVYRVDMRLRPDGSKGILVNDLAGYRNYYLKHARHWELQSLLKARPLAGDVSLLRAFHNLKKEVIAARGPSIEASEIIEMRGRIVEHLKKDTTGLDIKHCRGGIDEIEFAVQYLQLKKSIEYPELITFCIETAIKGLIRYGLIADETGKLFLETLNFFRTIEAILRLNEENILKQNSHIPEAIAQFLGLSSTDTLFEHIEKKRVEIINRVAEIYSYKVE